MTSDFCLACARARSIVEEAVRLVPGARMSEVSVVRSPDEAEALGIHVTPTVIVRNPDGEEVFRAGGVPTLTQMLTAAALALPAVPDPAAVPYAGEDGRWNSASTHSAN